MRLVKRERLAGAAAGLLAHAGLVGFRGKARRTLILLQGRRTHQLAILHQMVGLRAGEERGAARSAHRQTRAEPRPGRRAQRIGIEADAMVDAAADTSGVIPAVTEI